MQAWVPTTRYSWGSYPIGPVSNDVASQNFLWQIGQRTESNYELPLSKLAAGGLRVQELEFLDRPGTGAEVPAGCRLGPLDGDSCLSPPLAFCRQR